MVSLRRPTSTFALNGGETLVANFVPFYTVTVSAPPGPRFDGGIGQRRRDISCEGHVYKP